MRDHTVPKIDVDFEKSDFADFQVVKTKSVSKESIERPGEWKDHVLIQLMTVKAFLPGNHESMMTIVWKEDVFAPVQVPVKIQIDPFSRLAIDRLFIGKIKSGETKTVPVRMQIQQDEYAKAMHLVHADDGISVRHESGKLLVTVKSPDQQGRFEKSLSFTFQGDPMPTVLPVSGVVKP